MDSHSGPLCPCHSGKLYSLCCEPYHKNAAAENALDLMRSRYSAYALKLVDYIIMTTHLDNPQYIKNHSEWKNQIKKFCMNTKFLTLEIIEQQEGEKNSFITFHAGMKQNGQDASFSECSRFIKVAGRWLYHSGEIFIE